MTATVRDQGLPVGWRTGTAVVVIGAGCALLALRPLLGALIQDTTPALLVLFTGLLVAGVAWPAGRAARPVGPAVVAIVAAVGVAAFVIARLVAPGQAAAPFGARPLLLDGLAAVAEEAFFRRLVFAALLTAASGPSKAAAEPDDGARSARRFAIAGSAVLFAIVHVSVYGFAALPIDLAAGLLLSWQRDASGTWTVPAITHVIANALAVI